MFSHEEIKRTTERVRQISAGVDELADETMLLWFQLRKLEDFIPDGLRLGLIPEGTFLSNISNQTESSPSLFAPKSKILTWRGIELDGPHLRIPSWDVDISLTATESGITGKLITAEGAILSRKDFGIGAGSRSVDVHVRRIRGKVPDEYSDLIKTIRGFGYQMTPATD